jgi:uncharacterized membrane protein
MTPMRRASLYAEDDDVDATSGSRTNLAARRLSAGERAPWWRARVRLGELVSRSLVLIPSLYLAGAIVLGVLLPALDRGHGGKLLGIDPAEAQSILQAVAAGMIAFAGLVVSVAVLVVQLIDAYSLAFASLLLPGGGLGDRYGRGWPWSSAW